jgi:pseudouridine synthase
MLGKFVRGIFHAGEKLKAESARQVSKNVVELELSEGKNREVRRLFESQGLTVLRLPRTQIGKIKLGELKPGRWRALTDTEIKTLLLK